MLRRLFSNKNVKNGMWMYLLQIFNTILPLVTLPYITRVLGRAGYGTFSIALNVIGYLQVLIEYGFGMSATREVATSDKDQKTLSKVFTSVICSRLVLLGISIIIALIYLITTGADSVLWICMIVMLCCLFGYCVQQNWLFQGMQEMKFISIINIIGRSVSTVLIFLFVKNESHLYLYSFLYTVSPLVSGFSGLIISKRRFGVKFIKVGIAEIKNELEKGWYVFTTQLSSKVFGAIGITFLGLFSSNVEVGTFSAIQKIPHIMMLAWTPISQVLYPVVSQKMQISFSEGETYIKQAKKLFLTAFLCMAIIVGIFSKPIVMIAFGAEYADKFYWILPLLAWTVVSINNNFMGIQTLLASNHDKEYSKCFQIGVAITILLNFVLTYYFGGDGASIAPLLSETALSILLINQVRKVRRKQV